MIPRLDLCYDSAAWVSSCLSAVDVPEVWSRSNILFVFHVGKAIWKAMICKKIRLVGTLRGSWSFSVCSRESMRLLGRGRGRGHCALLPKGC